MKNIIVFLILFAFISVGLSGCDISDVGLISNDAKLESTIDKSDSPLSGDEYEDYYMIAFLSGLDYWKGCFKGFQEAGNQFGVRTVYVGDQGYDINKSLAVFNEVVAKNPAGIAIACMEPNAFKEPIRKAISSGIKVVTYDSDSIESGRLCYISTGNRDAGIGSARYLAKLINNEGEIAVLYTFGLQCAEERIDGLKEGLEKEFPKIKLVASADDKSDQIQATKAIKDILNQHPDIKAIYCASGIAGVSAATAVKEANKVGKVRIVGWACDKPLLDLVSDGTVNATIAQNTYAMGYWSMNILFHSKHDLSTDKYPVFIDTGYEFVTKENVKSFYNSMK